MSDPFDPSVHRDSGSYGNNLPLSNEENPDVGKLEGLEVAKDLSGPSLKTAKKVAIIALGIVTIGYGLGLGVGAYFLIKAGYKALKGDKATKGEITQNDVNEVKQSFAEKLENKKINETPRRDQVDLVKAKTIFHRLHTAETAEQLRMDPFKERYADLEGKALSEAKKQYDKFDLEGHNSAVILEDIKDDMKTFMETEEFKNLDSDIQMRFSKVHDRFFNVSATDMGRVIKECISDESYWDELCDGPMFFNFGTEGHNMTMQLNFKKDDENNLKVDILMINTGVNDIEFFTGDETSTPVAAKEVKNFDPNMFFRKEVSEDKIQEENKDFFEILGDMRNESSGREDAKMKILYEEFGMKPKNVFKYQSQGPVGICTYKSISSIMHQAISPKDMSPSRDLKGDIAWRKFKLHCLEKDMESLKNDGVVKVVEEAPLQKFYGRERKVKETLNDVKSIFGGGDIIGNIGKIISKEKPKVGFNEVESQEKINELIKAQEYKIQKIKQGIQKNEKKLRRNPNQEVKKYWP